MAEAPESPLAHFAKAQFLRARHRCDAAIPEYEIVLAANRNVNACCARQYRPMQDLHRATGRRRGVNREQAIRRSPHDPFLGVWYFRIGQARLLQSRVDEAISWLEKAHNENTAYAFVSWLACRCLYGLKGEFAACRRRRTCGCPKTRRERECLRTFPRRGPSVPGILPQRGPKHCWKPPISPACTRPGCRGPEATIARRASDRHSCFQTASVGGCSNTAPRRTVSSSVQCV